MKFDFIVVGAGFSGCVFAERIANQLNEKVLLIEKRDHIGGNSHDYYDSNGLLSHKYGPHWFHTNDKNVFDYVLKFTKWRFHEHRVKAFVNGLLLPFPINRDTINELYGLGLKSDEDVAAFFDSVRVKQPNEPKNSEEFIVSKIGWELYNLFFKNYSRKQWGIEPKTLSPTVMARIPIRTNKDDRYFTDLYQGIPMNTPRRSY